MYFCYLNFKDHNREINALQEKELCFRMLLILLCWRWGGTLSQLGTSRNLAESQGEKNGELLAMLVADHKLNTIIPTIQNEGGELVRSLEYIDRVCMLFYFTLLTHADIQ